MAKKILVTGGGGYIGRHVVDALLEMGHIVYVADQKCVTRAATNHRIDIPIFSGDKDIFQKTGSPDVLIHLAWSDGFRHNADSHIANLSNHYLFLRNMMEGGLTHVVGMGSMHEVGYYEGAVTETTPTHPRSPYGVAKNSLRQLTENVAASNGSVFQWVRGYYITGDDASSQSVFRKILDAAHAGEVTFPFVTGGNKYDFIDVEELAYQIAAVANQDKVNGIINCCSGEAISLADRARVFIQENHLNIELQYGAFPDRLYDSPAIWGDSTKIKAILSAVDK